MQGELGQRFSLCILWCVCGLTEEEFNHESGQRSLGTYLLVQVKMVLRMTVSSSNSLVLWDTPQRTLFSHGKKS